MIEYQRGLASMVFKIFDKKTAGSSIKSSPQSLTQVYSSFKDNICGADLADMQLISKFIKGFRFLLCVIDIFSKYASWVVPLKDKKVKVLLMHCIFKESDTKPNKI